MPPGEEGAGSERVPYAYAVIRVVPRVEREEFVNVGVVLFSRPRKYLGVRTHLVPARLRALWPDVDIDGVARTLEVIQSVARGDPAGGPIAALPAAERFGWISAPSSTVVQPGPVHAGLSRDPEGALDELFRDLVAVPTESENQEPGGRSDRQKNGIDVR